VTDPLGVALLTREFPPEVYGGAGVHVEYLSRELAKLINVGVHAFGAERDSELVHASYATPAGITDATMQVLATNVAMADALGCYDLVHSHTWYANLAGQLAQLRHGVPHVATTHSLEPLRPWKQEQLGGGYAVSQWCERTALESADAVIAVSAQMRADVLRCYPDIDPEHVHVVHNGIDTEEYTPDVGTHVLERLGLDAARPLVTFVGRITRQKGLVHLLDALRSVDPAAQVLLCAGAPDTPEIADEVRQRVARLASSRDTVVWVEEMLPRPDVVQLLSHTTAFVCPSIYEPFGLVNVEAMACGAPVVASSVGGIPEIVVHGVTGSLVEFEVSDDPYGTPAEPEAYALALAAAINALVDDPATARAMGAAGRERVVTEFSWPAIAARTVEVYRAAIGTVPAGR
jgi:starch synthase